MCILLSVGGKATVVPIPDESLPDKSGHQAARPRDLQAEAHVRELASVCPVVPTRGVVGKGRDLNLGSERNSGPFCCLPVGGLVLAWVGWDDVETWIGQQLVDSRDIGSDPGPMRVDVVGDAPCVVGRPDERGVGQMQSGLARPHLSGSQSPKSDTDPRNRMYARFGMATFGPCSTDGGNAGATCGPGRTVRVCQSAMNTPPPPSMSEPHPSHGRSSSPPVCVCGVSASPGRRGAARSPSGILVDIDVVLALPLVGRVGQEPQPRKRPEARRSKPTSCCHGRSLAMIQPAADRSEHGVSTTQPSCRRTQRNKQPTRGNVGRYAVVD